jgi:hypothetical protein
VERTRHEHVVSIPTVNSHPCASFTIKISHSQRRMLIIHSRLINAEKRHIVVSTAL